MPRTGRFLSEDGIRDGLNWYTYCIGNPIRFIDPTGHYFIVADREFDYIGGGEYRLGGLKGTYSIQKSKLITSAARAASNFIPFIGGFLSSGIINSDLYGDVIGGTHFNAGLEWQELLMGLGIDE